MGSSFPPAVAAKPLLEIADADGDVVTSAVCCGCREPIHDWRERLLPIVGCELVVIKSGELAVQVENRARCPRCGHRRAEIRVHGASPKAP